MNSKTTTASPIFILQKDIPTVKAGTEFARRPMYGGEYYVPYPRTSVGNSDMFHPDFVENNKEWFVKKGEDVRKEEDVEEGDRAEVTLAGHATKGAVVSCIVTGKDLIGIIDKLKSIFPNTDSNGQSRKAFGYIKPEEILPIQWYQKCTECGAQIPIPSGEKEFGKIFHYTAKSGSVYHKWLPDNNTTTSDMVQNCINLIEEVESQRKK